MSLHALALAVAMGITQPENPADVFLGS